MSARYDLRPKADQDLNEQAYYLATEGGPEVGHRFLLAAHDTFALLAMKPQMGWSSRLRHPELASVRVIRVSGFGRALMLYRPHADGVEILRVVSGSRDLEMFLRCEGLE